MDEQAPDIDATVAPEQARDSSEQGKSADIQEVAPPDKMSRRVSAWVFALIILLFAFVFVAYSCMVLTINSSQTDKLREAVENHADLIALVTQSKQDIARLRSDKLELEQEISTLTAQRDDLDTKVKELLTTKQEIDSYYQEYKLRKDNLEKEYSLRYTS